MEQTVKQSSTKKRTITNQTGATRKAGKRIGIERMRKQQKEEIEGKSN